MTDCLFIFISIHHMRHLLLFIVVMLALCAQASRIDTVAFSAPSGLRQRMCVYLPEGYDSTACYQVLYLLHGIHGNQYIWQNKGQIRSIMDSLIASGEVAPLVVVMPFCQIGDTCDRLEPGSLLRCCLKYPQIKRGKFERSFVEITAYCEERYAIGRGRSNRALAGLSCGARQAAVIARDSSFFACGLFSPVIYSDQLPDEGMQATEYWVVGGKKDAFMPLSKRFYRRLVDNGNRALFYTDEGGHSWATWRRCIALFCKKYFSAETHCLPAASVSVSQE